MCGIAGFVSLGPSSRVIPIAEMLACAHHRGPDGSGIYERDGVVLGHRRLAILDLSDRGAQPMVRDSLAITFNGEIFNYVEVRRDLETLGHDFVSDSDTEVLLAAYQEWGADCLGRLEGMWAFAIHDPSRNVLFCSRDRFGEKPFVFSRKGDSFVFASEPRQLRAVGMAEGANLERVKEFLAFGSPCDLRETYFDGVANLPPGSNLFVDLATGSFEEETYYRPGTSGIFNHLSGDDFREVLAEELHRAVAVRLRSDVPVGLLLSGGIDSSVLAALAGPDYARTSGRPMVAVTAVTGDPANDESAYAQSVARSCAMDWLPIQVDASSTRDQWRSATEVVQQPLGSSSHVLQLEVMRAASKEGIVVLLDGQGADELWLGYPRYAITVSAALPVRERISFLRRVGSTSDLGLFRQLQHYAYFGSPRVSAFRVRRLMRESGLDVSADWLRDRSQQLLTMSKPIQEVQRSEIHGEQLSALLRYADLTSMAFSLEERLPFLDHRLAELALATSASTKYREGWSKWPLRDFLSGKVADDVAWRRRKVGFEAHSASFAGRIPEVRELVDASQVLRDVGVATEQDNLSPRMLWRAFAVALWEDAVLRK